MYRIISWLMPSSTSANTPTCYCTDMNTSTSTINYWYNCTICTRTGKWRSIVSCTSYYVACWYSHKNHISTLERYFPNLAIRRRHLYLNVFGVKIKWAVYPLLPILLHQRYIFAPKIYLHPKDYFLWLSLVQREDSLGRIYRYQAVECLVVLFGVQKLWWKCLNWSQLTPPCRSRHQTFNIQAYL
jgi:hypothetical protein